MDIGWIVARFNLRVDDEFPPLERISKKRREKKRKKDLLSLTLNFFIYSSSRTERKNRDSSFLFFFLLFSSLEHACNREWDENGTQRGIKLVCTGV